MGMQNGLYSGRRCPIQLKVSLLQDNLLQTMISVTDSQHFLPHLGFYVLILQNEFILWIGITCVDGCLILTFHKAIRICFEKQGFNREL